MHTNINKDYFQIVCFRILICYSAIENKCDKLRASCSAVSRLFTATSWTVASRKPLSVKFSGQSIGVDRFPSLGHLPFEDLTDSLLQNRFFTIQYTCTNNKDYLDCQLTLSWFLLVSKFSFCLNIKVWSKFISPSIKKKLDDSVSGKVPAI